ncbi:MAG: LLM class flavin-dependent oxidoreductase [Micromonosporaceae bacterium]|nr:LLM class flavin-dependent oxidoreductase [Micromonosporaceae bacterium]
MRLGVFLNQHSAVPVAVAAEQLGYGLALVPEGYRCDAVSVLGAVAARTSRIGLGSGVMQIPARTPVLTALTASTLDSMSAGRFRLGLGVSNPDVSAGWYGVPFDAPLRRTREYVEVVRLALSGAPVRYHGRHYRLGEADAAQLAGPTPARLPIYLAGVGPRSQELAGEIGDGWVGVFSSPQQVAEALDRLRAGRRAAGAGEPGDRLAGFEVLLSVPIGVGDDLLAAAQPLRHYFANFIGLGSAERSIYHRLAVRMGFGEAASQIRAHLRAGDRAAAAAAVPFELIDATSLVGPVSRIAPRLAEYRAAGVTTLGLTLLAPSVEDQLATVRAAAAALARSSSRLLPPGRSLAAAQSSKET